MESGKTKSKKEGVKKKPIIAKIVFFVFVLVSLWVVILFLKEHKKRRVYRNVVRYESLKESEQESSKEKISEVENNINNMEGFKRKNEEEKEDICSCSEKKDLVCGSDLLSYRNECEAGCAGVEVLYKGGCKIYFDDAKINPNCEPCSIDCENGAMILGENNCPICRCIYAD